MSYSPSTMSDDNKPPPDPRYEEWDKRSRKELRERLYDAVAKRRDATEELIPGVIRKELDILGLCSIGVVVNDILLNYSISISNVISLTHESIDRQISDWKGLRWWRFNEKNACDSWNKWFKKAKCWQDQNQYKPLGRFWCLIFDELKQYTLNIARTIFNNDINKQESLQKCFYSKCIESILNGQVRFERTRETPLLPVRVLTQSKEIQEKLKQIDNGFTLIIWKQEAEKAHKRQKQFQQYHHNQHNPHNQQQQPIKNRANVATILNEKCCKYATNVYRKTVQKLKQIIPNLNINVAAIEGGTRCIESMSNQISQISSISIPNITTPINTGRTRIDRISRNKRNNNYNIDGLENGYGPSRGGCSSILRVESQRYSPTLSSNSISDISSLSGSSSSSNSDAISVGSRSSNRSDTHSQHHHHHNMRRIRSIPPKPPIPSSMQPQPVLHSNNDNISKLDRLSMENEELKRELAAMKAQLNNGNQLQTLIQQMTMQQHINQMLMAQKFLNQPPNIPSPMTVPMGSGIHSSMTPNISPHIPPSIMLNDGKDGHAMYHPSKGKLFYFPSKDSMDYNNNNNSNNNNNKNMKQPPPPNTINFDDVENGRDMNIGITSPMISTTADNNININNNNDNPSISTPGIRSTNCFCPEMSPYTPTPQSSFSQFNDCESQYGGYHEISAPPNHHFNEFSDPLHLRESNFDNMSLYGQHPQIFHS